MFGRSWPLNSRWAIDAHHDITQSFIIMRILQFQLSASGSEAVAAAQAHIQTCSAAELEVSDIDSHEVCFSNLCRRNTTACVYRATADVPWNRSKGWRP